MRPSSGWSSTSRTTHRDGVIDPLPGPVERLLPQGRIGGGNILRSEFQIDIRDLRIDFRQPIAKVFQVRGLGRREMRVLHFDVVDAVPIREHLPQVHDVERSRRAVGLRGILQNAIEAERHDGHAPKLRLIANLRPSTASAGEAGSGGGAHEKFPAFHRALPV